MIKNRVKVRNIQTILSINGLIPLFFAVLIFSVSFYIYASNALMEREKKTLMILADQLTGSLEAELKKMSNLALNISYSSQLKDEIQTHLSLNQQTETGDKQRQLYLNAGSMVRTIGEITGPYKTVPQVNIIFPNLNILGKGIYELIHPLTRQSEEIISKYDWHTGALIFSSLHQDSLAGSMSELYQKVWFISLYKAIFDDYHNPLGILEIKQFSDTLFGFFNRDQERILVFDSKGAGVQIYPAISSQNNFYAELAIRNNSKTIQDFKNPSTGKREIIAVTECLQSGWIVLTITDGERYLKPVYQFLIGIIGASLLILGAGFFISKILSRLITDPLKDLNHKISRLAWDKLDNTQSGKQLNASLLNEVNELHLTFQEMNKKLDSSLSEMIAEKTLQTQSRLLALQAQMDPHFMYNMLSTLSIMIEDKENSEAMGTIKHMTRILRYISNGTTLMVTLQEELDIIEHYISCMHIRFGNLLTFSSNLPESMLTLHIPRHSLLPLVENAIKYGMDNNPPWIIHLEGTHTTKSWQISLKDNGPGFPEKSLTLLKSQMEQCRKDKSKQLDFHINGMGLINLFSRLLIFYGDTLTFDINNSPDNSHGSAVTIGGSNESQRKLHFHHS
ncbi:MAG: histidine kinase [Bacteroidetes bacterium]|nr:histidine kinase [Bacteroidota bacterium]